MMSAVCEMKKHSMDGVLKSELRYQLPFRVDPGEKRVTLVGTSDGCRVAAVDLFERKKEEKMDGCLIVDAPVKDDQSIERDNDDDDDDQCPPSPKKLKRMPKPNPRYY